MSVDTTGGQERGAEEDTPREIGDELRIELTKALTRVISTSAALQNRLLDWTITNAEDVLAVLDDVRKVRDAHDVADNVTRRALRRMP